MEFKFSNDVIEKIKSDIVVLLCQQKTADKKDKGKAILQKSDGGTGLDKFLNSLLSDIISKEGFRGEICTYKLIHTHGAIPAKAVLLMGAGKPDEFNPDTLRKIGAKIATVANEIRATSAAGIVQPETVKGFKPDVRLQMLVEGFILGSYSFDKYKNKNDVDPKTLKDVIFISKGSAAKLSNAVKTGSLTAENVNMVRDLVNTTAKDLTPDALAKKAREVALTAGLRCEVLGPKEIEKEKMNLLLAVAHGSENEPRFVHLSYRPKKAKTTVALIGKGITFDSGGYDLKPSIHMLNMKQDMAGAATCIAVMKIISALKAPVAVDAYLPITDNMIDAKAHVPGNIITSRCGKTVEIVNTDAEGRLILADTISYALDKKPDFIIDVATLTGGVLYALGEIYTAVLGNDQRLIDKYLSAAKAEGEPAWQLPLVKEYKKDFSEGPADMKNSAKSKASTIVGALFLEEFVGDAKWLHLDIAYSAWADEDHDYIIKGGTGTTVRSLARLIATL